MNKSFLLPFGLALAMVWTLPGAVEAQYTAVEPAPAPAPRPPLMAIPGDGSSWTVEHRPVWDLSSGGTKNVPAQAAPGAGSRTVSWSKCRKGNGTIIEEVLFGDGTRTTNYFVQGYAITTDPAGELAIDSADGDGAAARPDTLAEFGWISAQNFVGEAAYQGVVCHVYRETRPNPQGKPIVVRSAYIHKETRLPAGIEDGLGIRKYHFEKLREPVILPPEAAAAIGQPDPVVEKTKIKYNVPQ